MVVISSNTALGRWCASNFDAMDSMGNPSTYVAKLHTYLDPSADSKKSRKHTNWFIGSDGTSTQVTGIPQTIAAHIELLKYMLFCFCRC